MSDLTDHMNDHLGGSVAGLGLAKHLAKEYEGEPLGELAGRLVDEIEQDRDTLKTLIESFGESPSAVKQAGGWLGDRAAILLKARGEDAHSRLSLLEALSIGIEGKAMLWRALQGLDSDRLDEARLADLEQRALRQRSELEPFRVAAMRELAAA